MNFNFLQNSEQKDEAATEELRSSLVNIPLETKKLTHLGRRIKNGYRSLNSARDVRKIQRHKIISITYKLHLN